MRSISNFHSKPLAISVAMVLAMMTAFPTGGADGEGVVMGLIRPKPRGQQISPTWTEIYYIVIDARHPDGIEKLQLFKEGAKQPEKGFSEKDRHESGYFLYKRRMKSRGIRDYVIKMWPVGSDPRVDEPITSDLRFPIEYSDPDPRLTEHISFTNLSDGDVIRVSEPGDSTDLTPILVDCQHSSGSWGGGQWKGHRHMGYRDDDGIEWVELVVTGPDGKAIVIRNDSALILERDQAYHGPYWGEPVDPVKTKPPEERWEEGVEWKPIEGFGLHLFRVSFSTGRYELALRAKTAAGEVIEGPVITITVKSTD